MLLLNEHFIPEYMDGQGGAGYARVMGDAVLTALRSEAQPSIRHRTGHVVQLAIDSCREGRRLHVIGEVAGRTTDLVVRPDGADMHAADSVAPEDSGKHLYVVSRAESTAVDELWRCEPFADAPESPLH